MKPTLLVIGLGISSLLALSCAETPVPQPPTQRLVDVFEPGFLADTAKLGAPPAPTEWRFAGSGTATDTLGWQGFEGVEGLRVEDGKLVGRTTAEIPILHVSRGQGADDPDPLHEIQIRMRVSGGDSASMSFFELMPPVPAIRDFWMSHGPTIADGEMRTYSYKPWTTITSASAREIFMRPSDAAGVEFEIEWVRLVFRREHLAQHPSGIGWYGLDGDYRETVVARAPETIRWSLILPERSHLDLGLGNLAGESLTFRVSLDSGSGEEEILTRSLDPQSPWQDVDVDLLSAAGREVTLTFALEGEPGTLGLWGAPAVRNRASLAAGEVQGVVFILADTLRPDRMSLYGHDRPTTPRIAQLAQAGTVFRDMHAHAPWTRVSVPSIVTSLYPSVHGVHGFHDRLPNTADTLAELYRQAGWATMAFSSIPHTGRSANMHQGYEVLHEPPYRGGSKTAQGFIDRLLPWLGRHQDDRFFVFLHVFDPHWPYEPGAPHDAMWVDPARSDAVKQQAFAISQHASDPLKAYMGLARRREIERAGIEADAYIEHNMGWYDGSIRSMDDQLGRIQDRLNELGLADDTLVVFTSDHGEEFLDHDWMGHGHSLYTELTHVPFFLSKPGLVPAGKVIEKPVQHVDLMPTILELSGLPIPDAAQGQSLVSLMTPDAADPAQPEAPGSTGHTPWRERPIFVERPASDHPTSPAPRAYSSFGVIFDGWKLIQHGEGRGETPEYELYDDVNDPLDRHDLAAERPETVARLAELLDAWRQDAAARQLESDTTVAAELTQEELERLRSLGYIE